jgi:plastocyanin
VRRLALRIALIAACCGGPVDAAPVVHKVAIDGFEFRPPVATVKLGDTVEWGNADPVPHTATAKDAGLDSGVIAAGKAFRFTAKRKGRYDYVCTLHPTMKGTLVVE